MMNFDEEKSFDELTNDMDVVLSDYDSENEKNDVMNGTYDGDGDVADDDKSIASSTSSSSSGSLQPDDMVVLDLPPDHPHMQLQLEQEQASSDNLLPANEQETNSCDVIDTNPRENYITTSLQVIACR